MMQAQSLSWKALGILKLTRSVASPQAREGNTFANISIMSPSAVSHISLKGRYGRIDASRRCMKPCALPEGKTGRGLLGY